MSDRPCQKSDLIRDYVGDGREYRGHNGTCENCGKEYSESDDGDLNDAHWLHTIESERTHWEATTSDDVKALALVMDPDDPKLTNRAPHQATEHAVALLASGWLARVKAEAGAKTLREAAVAFGENQMIREGDVAEWLRVRAALVDPTTPTPTEGDQG